MKRLLVDRKCFEEELSTIPIIEPERRNVLFGKALDAYVCDHCGEPYGKGEEVFAVSFWTTAGGIPYYSWEMEYLEPETENAIPGGNISTVGDLTELAEAVVEVFRKRFGGDPAVAIAFQLADDSDQVHWVTNVSRDDGIKLMQFTAAKMVGQTN